MPDSQPTIRILHLEDSPRDAAMVADLLDVEGMCGEIIHVTHRKPFEEALEQSRFDLILCDFNLLDFDGLAALKMAKEKYPETPVIIVSGAIDSEEAVACLRAGATDYLLKQRLERLPSAVLRAQEEVNAQKQRQRDSARLSESEERFRQLAENIDDVFWLTDIAKNQMIYVSPAYEVIWGRTCASLQASPRQWIEAIHPEDRGRVLHATVDKQSAGSYDEEYRIIRPDGEIHWIRDQAFPVRDESGAVYRIAGVARDITERRLAREQILKSLHEKETLLKEIHHRVKNNLQVISSLLSMQADSVVDSSARNLLQESQHRVRAMAMIHEKLYQSDSLAKVDFGDYVSNLATFLHHNYVTSAPVHLVVDADEDVSLNIDTAIPAGLILNELVTNAFKHAFKDGQPHVLKVLLKKSDGGCSLTVADDGPGLPAGFAIGKSESLGMELVNALTAQLKARLTVENKGGTHFRLDFNELIYADRN